MKMNQKILLLTIAITVLLNIVAVNRAAMGEKGHESDQGYPNRKSISAAPKPLKLSKNAPVKKQPVVKKQTIKKPKTQPAKTNRPIPELGGVMLTPPYWLDGGMPAVMYPNGACKSDDNCVRDGGYSCDLSQPITVNGTTYPGTCNQAWLRNQVASKNPGTERSCKIDADCPEHEVWCITAPCNPIKGRCNNGKCE